MIELQTTKNISSDCVGIIISYIFIIIIFYYLHAYTILLLTGKFLTIRFLIINIFKRKLLANKKYLGCIVGIYILHKMFQQQACCLPFFFFNKEFIQVRNF